MPGPKYPLKPLLEHRDRQVDAATTGLADAVRAHDAAERARLRAEETRTAAEARMHALRVDEARRLENGELRAVDLARGGAWEVGARAEVERLARAERDAEGAALRAGDDEAAARAALAQRTSERDVVAKDESKFVAAAQRRVLAKEEESAEEARRASWSPTGARGR